MLNKDKLLYHLIELKNVDERKKRESETVEEYNMYSGSLITLETLIEFIEEGRYDV